MQKRIDPSGLGTRTTGLAHSDVVGSMTPAFSIRCTSDDSDSRARAPARYGFQWTGVAPGTSSVRWDVVWTFPNLPSHIER
jgi:hypothetical protein